MTASRVHLLGKPWSVDRVAFVDDNGALVRVRFRLDGRMPWSAWRCDRCGRSAYPACQHARETARAAIAQIDQLLDGRKSNATPQ